MCPVIRDLKNTPISSYSHATHRDAHPAFLELGRRTLCQLDHTQAPRREWQVLIQLKRSSVKEQVANKRGTARYAMLRSTYGS